MLSRRHFPTFLVCFLAAVVGRAQTPVTWLGITSDFTAVSNWSGILTSGLGTNIAEFTGTGLQPTLNTSFTLAGVRFNTGSTTLSGTGLLTVGSSGIENFASADPQTISVGVAFGASSGRIKNSGSLTLSGSVQNDTAGGLTLEGSGFSGVVSGVISGTGALIKEQSGSWTLTGANTYTGGTVLRNGALSISSDANLGAVPGSMIPDSLRFEGGALRALADVTVNANRGMTVVGSGTLEADTNATLTYSGAITGTGTLRKQGAGTLVLGGTSDLAGSIEVQNGTLRTGSADALSRTAAVLLTSSTAVLDLVHDQAIAGLGGWIASAGSTTTISPGATLTINNSGQTYKGTIGGGGAVVITGAGSQTFAGANTYTGGTTISSGILIATNSSGSATGTGNVTVAPGAVLQLGNHTAGGSVSGDILNDGTILFAATEFVSYAGVISGTGALNIGFLNDTGGGTLALTGANTFTGPVDISSGVLQVGATNTLPTNVRLGMGEYGILDVAADQTIGQIRYSSPGSMITIDSGRTLTVAPTAAQAGSEFLGTIVGLGAVQLNGVASGVLTLSGENEYSGGTTVTSGTVQLGSSSRFEGVALIGGPLGTGTVTIASSGGLGVSHDVEDDIVIGNPVELASGAAVSGGVFDNALVLTGTTTLPAGAATVEVGDRVDLAGVLTSGATPGATALTVTSQPGAFGQLVVSGSIAPSIGSLTANNAAVIFGSASAVPASGLTLHATSGYIGVGKTSYGPVPTAASVLALIPNRSTFDGTFGFDTDEGIAAHLFAEPLNLSGFEANFTLGSVSRARISGPITIDAGTDYRFGNGGGVLAVESALTGSHGVVVSSTAGLHDNTLVAVLRGNNSFSGGLSIANSAAVLDSATALPAGRTIGLGTNGYVGYTEAFTPAATFSDFLGRVTTYTPTSVVGIDSSAYIENGLTDDEPNGVRVVSETIDLTNLSSIYFGTMTNLHVRGTVKAPAQGGANQTLSLLAGYDDAVLTIESPLLAGNVNAVVVGAAGGSEQGTVRLAGANTHTGGTTLISGNLELAQSSKKEGAAIVAGALGTGVLTVPETAEKPRLAATSNVTVDNPITLGSVLLLGWEAVEEVQNIVNSLLAEPALTLNGVIGDLDATRHGSLVITSHTVLNGANTFSGGVWLQSGELEVGHDTALGTGALHVGPSFDELPDVTLTAGNGARTLANAIVYDGAPDQRFTLDGGSGGLTLAGPVTLNHEMTLSTEGSVRVTGSVGGTGRLVLEGGRLNLASTTANTYSGGTRVEEGVLVFENPSSLPTSGLLATSSWGYIGISFVPSSMTDYLRRFSQFDMHGTIGFDSPGATPQTFSGAIDLSGFSSFPRLGSSTRAILAGVITPGGTSYAFGNGGGVLEVTSALGDGTSSRSLDVYSTPDAPLTLRLTGANTYTGSTGVEDSALIFGPNALPGATIIATYGGAYVGTEDSAFGANPAGFIARFDPSNTGSIIGFDSFGASPFEVTGPVNLGHFTSTTDPEIYLGTTTKATIRSSSTISLPAAQSAYRFAGYKGGQLTVETTLADAGGQRSVVIGDRDNMATFGDGAGDSSTVILTGNNTYTGGTVLEAGSLVLAAVGSTDTPLGTGTLRVSAQNAGGEHVGLFALNTPQTIANAVVVDSGSWLDIGGAQALTLNGPLSGTGELFKVGSGTLRFGGNNGAFAGGLTIEEGAVAFASGSGLGDGDLSFGSAGGSVLFEGSTTLHGISGGSASSVVTIASGKTVTIAQGASGEYAGSFAGSGGNVAFTGSGTELRLSGASTFTGTATVGSGISVVASNNLAFGSTANVLALNGGRVVADHGVTISNPMTISAGTLGGAGTFKAVGTGFTIGSGVVLDPGLSPGTLTIDGSLLSSSALILAGGGTMKWEIADAGAAGGWDQVAVVGGSVAITATSSNPFTFSLRSVYPDGGSGLMTNFNPGLTYSWTVLTVGSGKSITGFNNPDQFAFDLSGFAHAGAGTFSVSLNPTGSALSLTFTPIPEPSSYVLMILGAGLTVFVTRRRRQP